MTCCSPDCKKWGTLSASIVLIVLGVLTAAGWNALFTSILNYQLSVSSPKTIGYNMWKETPIPMYLEIFLFNWTNVEEVQKYQAKPKFAECGPYTFHEHHLRTNVTFNDNNGTITFMTKRTWIFEPNRSNGSLDDKITTLNPIAATVANLVKDSHIIVREGVNFFFIEKHVTLAITKQVNEFLFDGYTDELLNLAHKLNLTKLKVPFSKFGWFVERNNSITYDGVYNMDSGLNSVQNLGKVLRWNFNSSSEDYPGTCGEIQGTTGELWYPTLNDENVTIFSSDLCSTVVLHRNGSTTHYSIEGTRYTAQELVFDNGTKYPENLCYNDGNHIFPSGIRDVSKCKFNAPAYVSFPHFFLADPYYRNAIEGMQPDQSKHQMEINIEPSSGLPLTVKASFQVNLMMKRVKGISIFSDVNTTLMPCMWFRQTAELTEDLATDAKIMLVASSAGTYTGYGFLVIGLILLSVFSYVTYRKAWNSKEEEQLLSDKAL